MTNYNLYDPNLDQEIKKQIELIIKKTENKKKTVKIKAKTVLDKIFEEAEKNKKIYKNTEEILKDASQIGNNENYNSLFCFLYSGLCYISKYPLYKNREPFYYYDIDTKNEVEEELLIASLKVLKNVKNCIEPEKTVLDTKNLILKQIRNIAQPEIFKVLQIVQTRKKDKKTGNIISRYIKRIFLLKEKEEDGNDTGNNTIIDKITQKNAENNTMEDKIIQQYTDKFIENKLKEFTKDKDKKDKIIFWLGLFKSGEFEGRKFDKKLTEKDIAEIIGIHYKTVAYRKKKLREELFVYWEKEIKPFL